MYSTLEHALAYYDAGFNVMPLQGKRPVMASWDALKDKRSDREKVASYFTRNPDANIGIICGAVSNLTVVDFDVKAYKDKPHLLAQAKAAFLKEYRSPLMVETGSGGYHAYFQYVKNSKNHTALQVGALSLDVKTQGGYVAAPPSLHPDTKVRYKWLAEEMDINLIADLMDMLPEIPETLARCMSYHQTHSRTPQEWSGVVEMTHEGSRNSNATALIGKVLGVFPSHEWKQIAWPLISGWNATYVKPPLPEHELAAVFNSIAKKELSRRAALDAKMGAYGNSTARTTDTEKPKDGEVRADPAAEPSTATAAQA